MKKKKTDGIGTAIIVAFFVTFSVSVSAVDSSYIEAIEAEIEEFETGKFSLSSSSPWIAKADSGSGTTDVKSFAKFLRRELPGTYILFVRLPKSTQQELFQNYVDSGDLGRVRNDIYDLLYRKSRR